MREDGTYDITEKLSEADHGHLKALWDVTSLRRNASNLGVADGTAIRAEFWSYDEYESQVASAAETDEEPTPAEQPPSVPGGSSSPVPATVGARQALGAPASPDAPAAPATRAFANDELAGKPYMEWTKEQLKAEVDKRNEDRKGWDEYEPMSASGNKPELAEALSEDDLEDADDEGASGN